MEHAVIWSVVWGLAAFLTSGIVCWVVAAVFVFIGLAVDKLWVAIVGTVLGWLAGATWFVLCIIWCIQSIFTAVQLA